MDGQVSPPERRTGQTIYYLICMKERTKKLVMCQNCFWCMVEERRSKLSVRSIDGCGFLNRCKELNNDIMGSDAGGGSRGGGGSSNALIKALQQKELEISKRSEEHSVIFDQHGNIILEKKGTQDYVDFTDTEVAKMLGKILTHNHSGGSSFSPGDINFAIANNLKEMRAVGKESYKKPDGSGGERLVHYSVRPKLDTSKVKNAETMHKKPIHKIVTGIVGRTSMQVRRENVKKRRTGTLTAEQAHRSHWDQVWKQAGKNLKKVGVSLQYTRKTGVDL